jgi:hypothetical protein
VPLSLTAVAASTHPPAGLNDPRRQSFRCFNLFNLICGPFVGGWAGIPNSEFRICPCSLSPEAKGAEATKNPHFRILVNGAAMPPRLLEIV